MRRLLYILTLFFIVSSPFYVVATQIRLPVEFGTLTVPNGTIRPAICGVGDIYFDTSAPAGQNMYGCTASNIWTLEGGGTLTTSAPRVTTMTTDITITSNDGPLIRCSAGATDKTATLPVAATTTQGRVKLIKVDNGAGECRLAPAVGNTLNGSINVARVKVPWTFVEVEADGANSNWFASFGQMLPPRTCMIVIGADNGPLLGNADLGPQLDQCRVDRMMTVSEIAVFANTGTPSVMVHKRVGTINTVLMSSAVATGAAGALACANATGGVGLDGSTVCSATLQNTIIPAGATLGLTSGTAGGAAKRMTIAITMTID